MTRTHRRTRPKRFGAVRAALALCTVAGFGVVSTLAVFSDNGVQVSTFSAGSINLKFDGTTNDNPTGLSSLTFTNAAPGAQVVKPLTVNNTGTLAIVYSMSVSTTTTTATNLASALQLTVLSGVTTANCTAANVAAGTTGGTVLTNAVTLSSSPTFSSAQTIAASGGQSLCLSVTLPATVSNTYQGTNASATFQFTASPA